MDNVTIWYKVARPEFFSVARRSFLCNSVQSLPWLTPFVMFESKSLYSKSIDNNITLFVHQNRFSLQLRRFAFRNSIPHTQTRAHTAAHIPYSTSKLILSLWQPYIAKHKQQSQNQTGGRQVSLSIVAHLYANKMRYNTVFVSVHCSSAVHGEGIRFKPWPGWSARERNNVYHMCTLPRVSTLHVKRL